MQIIINHRLLNPEFKRERTDVTYTSDNYVGCINSFTRKDAHKINMYSRSVFISQYMNVSTVLRCSYYFSGCRRINQIIFVYVAYAWVHSEHGEVCEAAWSGRSVQWESILN